jgi:hypothetical protein
MRRPRRLSRRASAVSKPRGSLVSTRSSLHSSLNQRMTSVLALLLLAGCSNTSKPESEDPTPTVATASVSEEATPSAAAPTVGERIEPDLGLAESTPVEDSVYPAVGGPDVDALLYDLDLAWAPGRRTLTGTATITFRAARTVPRFNLDLARALRVTSVTFDGTEAKFAQTRKDLMINRRITEDDRHELVILYSGKPRPVPAPTTR